MVVTTLGGWGHWNTTPSAGRGSEPQEEGLRPWCVHLPLQWLSILFSAWGFLLIQGDDCSELGYHLLLTSSRRLDLFWPLRGKRWGRASSLASALGATGLPTTAEAT